MRDPSSSKARERARRADRKRRYRLRQAEGRAVYAVEVGPDVLDLLIRLHWIPEGEVGDRSRVAEMISALLRDAAKRR